MFAPFHSRKQSLGTLHAKHGFGCAGWYLGLACVLALLEFVPASFGADKDNAAVSRFQEDIQPILIDYCYRCHAEGVKKGGVTFDQFVSDESMLGKRDLWSAVLKNVRAGIMPPAEKPRPSDKELQLLAGWIKRDVFGLDPKDPDPGRVTIRRLNRVEYRNTIRDLMGFDFKAEEEFPPDDTGYGFDNIGDVLSVSPLLLEKYMQAAESIVASAVPTVSKLMPERTYRGSEFHGPDGKGNADRLSFYTPAKVSRSLTIENAGDYRIALELTVNGAFIFDPGRCAVTFKIDDKQLARETYAWQDGKTYRYAFEEKLAAGDHKLNFEVEPLSPVEKKVTSIDVRLVLVRVQGPMDPKHWTRPGTTTASGPKANPLNRHRSAGNTPGMSCDDSRPAPSGDRWTTERSSDWWRSPKGFISSLAVGSRRGSLARWWPCWPRLALCSASKRPNRTPSGSSLSHPLLDEYALASRLSYFLWSTMPDDELMRLAEHHELRKNLAKQVKRMREDSRAEALTRNFVGQWLQVRDVEGITINTRAVLRQEGSRARIDLDGNLRRAMRRETEMVFAHVAHEDRGVLDLIDSDYTFVNAKLAELYGIKGVTGNEMRKVALPKDSPRGGVLTHAAVLMVTSNPDRTSPVKRGQFILDNILGTPTPPPPPDIPALGRLEEGFQGSGADRSRADGAAPIQALMQLLPFPDGSPGPGARKLQRNGTLARKGTWTTHRCVGTVDHRRVVPRRPRLEANPQGPSPP